MFYSLNIKQTNSSFFVFGEGNGRGVGGRDQKEYKNFVNMQFEGVEDNDL